MKTFEGRLVNSSATFQPTLVYFCSFLYLRLRRRQMDKVMEAGALFFKCKLYSWSETCRICSSFKWEFILQLIYSCARDHSTIICPGSWMHWITTQRCSETSTYLIFSCIHTTFSVRSQQSPQPGKAWRLVHLSQFPAMLPGAGAQSPLFRKSFHTCAS